MSDQIVRLGAGETIHIRTGVIQGIGPSGPVGPAGPPGPTGSEGPQGIPGPVGYVDESVTEATGSGTVANNANGTASFSTVVSDEAAVYASSTTLSLWVGGWQGTAWIRFAKRSGVTGTGTRRVEVLLGANVVAATSVAASPDVDTDVTVPFTVKPTVQSNLTVRLYQTDGATINYTGRLWVSRIGAGIQGVQGPAGPAGPAGPQGATGPAGPAGSYLDPDLTFADMEAAG